MNEIEKATEHDTTDIEKDPAVNIYHVIKFSKHIEIQCYKAKQELRHN